MARYVELQVTSHFSFLRGASSPEELFSAAALLGHQALGLADWGSVAGVVRGWAGHKATGVRMIAGIPGGAILPFYDALADNPSAKALMKDAVLREIAHELADKLRRNLTVDWEVRESVRARLRLMVKSVLSRRGYPPDEAITATELILKQAETLASELMPA